MMNHPAVVVHGPGDLRAALTSAMPLTLLSAPAAALYAGAGWWRELMVLARAIAPGLAIEDVLDCADAPGRALEALALGQPALVLDPALPAFAEIAAIAEARGTRLLAARPPALDLAQPGAARRLAAWLAAPRGDAGGTLR